MNKESNLIDMNLLEDIINELRKYYNSSTRQPVFTLPEIFSKQDRETFISAWLAYLLNSQNNGFGNAPLNALLGLMGEYSVDENEQVIVETEHTFTNNGRRIDILITTSSYLIGIENKLYSYEQFDQTNDYWKSMKSICKDKKELLCIYLKPDANNSYPQNPNFKVITYAQLCEAFRSIPYDHCRDSRKNFFFYEFILYVEEKLMSRSNTGFPEMKEDVRWFHENSSILKKAQLNFNKFVSDLGVWLKNRIEELAPQFKSDLPKSSFWQIRDHEEWVKLNFHFELMWDNTKCISEIIQQDTVWLCIHLESARPEVKQFFGSPMGSSLHKERIEVDFSDEAHADESVMKIIKRLCDNPYREYAIKANECLLHLN